MDSTVATARSVRWVLVCANPRAGSHSRKEQVAELQRQLENRGFYVEVFEDVGGLASKARALQTAGQLAAVVAAGGDGTFRRVAEETLPGCPLLVFPLGTENLLARYLGLTADPREAAAVIDCGVTVRLDAGLANGKLFALMVGCGFDAEVVRRLHKARQGHISHVSYIKPILEVIRSYEYPPLRVRYRLGTGEDGEPITARWVFVINIPQYAGGLKFAPQASGLDGRLDLCTFREGSLWYGLLYLGGVMLGQQDAMEDYRHCQATELVIEAEGPVPYQIDGDPGGALPVAIQVLPGRLTMLVSALWLARHLPSTETAQA
jgi:diacylglycerol kinase family enzyme